MPNLELYVARSLDFEFSYEYIPSKLEVGFDAHSNDIMLEALVRNGFINSQGRPLVPFEISSRNEVRGPDENGKYFVVVNYRKLL